ncbi:MAG: magnesium transporter [Verrucomicrobiales bacterium]|nr:magnesium transporter [Verrucomicrobiales bacterium]|tara:strand:- start:5819 stop:6232 length:414 start_codon:yes stop_codon:yes gene_type:complete
MAEGGFYEPEGLHVTVDRVLYTPNLPSPPDQPFSFVYFITIHNDSERIVTIKGRKWVVKDAAGSVTVVEGDGVVGEFPTLSPGEHFSYNSRHTLATPTGEAEGSYIGLDDSGCPILTRIPRFEMDAVDGPSDDMGWA